MAKSKFESRLKPLSQEFARIYPREIESKGFDLGKILRASIHCSLVPKSLTFDPVQRTCLLVDTIKVSNASGRRLVWIPDLFIDGKGVNLPFEPGHVLALSPLLSRKATQGCRPFIGLRYSG